VTNIYRDQLDRYGELDGAAKKVVKASISAKKTLYYGRDPSLSEIARISSPNIVTFNVDKKYYQILPLDNSQTELTDTTSDYTLRKIQQKENMQYINIEHKKSSVDLSAKLLGAYNALNVLAAYCLANELGIKPDTIKTALAEVQPLFGRGETIQYKGKSVSIELVKNPTGFNQVISNLLVCDQPILFLINDKLADGRDVSWLWDVDLNRLDCLRSSFFTGGSRGLDMQLRLRYAGISAEYTSRDVEEAIMSFFENKKDDMKLTIVATYTAMLEAREILKKEVS
jgi:lipid II isoglutaminyl synthase (glutamine-hydrolysing)